MLRLRLEHFVETLRCHEREVLRQQLVPVDGDERGAVLEQISCADFLGHAVKRHARANVDGGDECTFAEACDNGKIPRSDNEAVNCAFGDDSLTH